MEATTPNPKISTTVWYRVDIAGEWVRGVRHWYSEDEPYTYGQGASGREPIQTRFECVEGADDDYMNHTLGPLYWRPRNEGDPRPDWQSSRPGEYRP